LKHFIRLTVGFLVFSLTMSAFNASQARAQTSNNAHQAAKNAGSKMSLSSGLSLAAAALLTVKCTACLTGCPGGCPCAVPICAMAAQAAKQGGEHGGDAKDSFKSAQASLCDSAPTLCTGGDTASGGLEALNPQAAQDPSLAGKSREYQNLQAQINKVDAITRKSEELQNKLADKGFEYDPATNSVKTPNGKSISADTLNSPGAAQALGLSKAEAEQLQAELKQIALRPLDINYASGGGSLAPRAAAVAESGSNFNMSSFMNGMNGGRKPASDLNGFKKYVGSEPIGVSVDNIFEMVSRRYKAQEGQGAFLP
jgi:hypothetical protein